MVDTKDTDTSLSFQTKRDTEARLRHSSRVMNKEITVEKILQEGCERQEQEFTNYRRLKRKKFEDSVRYNNDSSNWIKYAEWEESQKDFARARSVYERALTVNYDNQDLLDKYTELEIRNRFARRHGYPTSSLSSGTAT